jgi:hypothetical protein
MLNYRLIYSAPENKRKKKYNFGLALSSPSFGSTPPCMAIDNSALHLLVL